MNIYFAHSKDFDYQNEYYKPIEKRKNLQNETLIFPHKYQSNNKHDRSFYSGLDIFIAEVSYKATGLGIELGFASDDQVPIYCFYRGRTKPNSSLKCLTNYIKEYNSTEELILYIEEIVNKHKALKNNK